MGEDASPELSAPELAHRFLGILETAVRLVRQMPDDQLDRQLPNRPRSWRVLMHHVFQVPTAFLDSQDSGEMLTHENLVAPPPGDMLSSDAIARFGAATRERFAEWWSRSQSDDFDVEIVVYFGTTSRHELLERTVWHSTQHVRQVASLLEQAGVRPDRPLSAQDLRGLPLTERVWDEM